MKYFVIGLIAAMGLSLAAPAQSQGHRHGHGHFHGHGHRHYNPGWWVAPAVIGGIVTYAATRPYIVEQPVIVQQPQVLQPNQVVIDGVLYQRQIMTVNGVQEEVLVRVQ